MRVLRRLLYLTGGTSFDLGSGVRLDVLHPRGRLLPPAPHDGNRLLPR